MGGGFVSLVGGIAVVVVETHDHAGEFKEW
jgi:hypothetical protein